MRDEMQDLEGQIVGLCKRQERYHDGLSEKVYLISLKTLLLQDVSIIICLPGEKEHSWQSFHCWDM